MLRYVVSTHRVPHESLQSAFVRERNGFIENGFVSYVGRSSEEVLKNSELRVSCGITVVLSNGIGGEGCALYKPLGTPQ